jgi:hypothetical protein
MRFLVLVKSDTEWAGELPSAEMGAFNEALIRDGVLVTAEGLQPSAKGARIRYERRRPIVTDGPFAEAKELVAGFWILQAPSKADLIERLSQCPLDDGQSVEIRQIFEPDDFAANADVADRLRSTALDRARTENLTRIRVAVH